MIPTLPLPKPRPQLALAPWYRASIIDNKDVLFQDGPAFAAPIAEAMPLVVACLLEGPCAWQTITQRLNGVLCAEDADAPARSGSLPKQAPYPRPSL